MSPGRGTATVATCAGSRVVDQTQTVTLTWQGPTGSGVPVGSPVSATVTVTPIDLRDFSVSTTVLRSGQSATGAVTLEAEVNEGNARVNISATPTRVQVPTSIQIGCCLTDGAGH